MSIIVDVRTFARYSNIAALVLRERVPTFLMSIPSFSGPIDFTVETRCRLTCVDVNLTNFPAAERNVLTVVRTVVLG